MKVEIDGVVYAPTDESVGPTGPRIGVAITTFNRPEGVATTVDAILRLTPPGTPVVVVDDAGPVAPNLPSDVTYHRFRENRGIAAAKNKGLEILYDLGVEHFFLFDDDAYPLVDEWWKPYVENREPHLMYVFREFAGRGAPKLNDCVVLREQDDLVAYSTPRGVLLYIDRPTLERAGGMDLGFGRWGYEHGDWSNRIHAMGLTSFRYADVPDSGKLIYSLDEHHHELPGGHQRSIPRDERKSTFPEKQKRHDEQYNMAITYPFRETRNVVLSAYLTGEIDPQRKTRWAPDAKAVTALTRSVAKFVLPTEMVIFANQLEAAPDATIVKVEEARHPYFDRWLHYYRYLREHPEVEFAWCVDATDVVLLNEPFNLERGKLYVGSEPTTVGSPWMVENGKQYAEFIAAHADELLLNCGLIGGDRETVMLVCQHLVREYHDFKGASKPLQLDMAAFNYVVREFDFDYVTGPKVHTVFRAKDHSNKIAMWAHK